jgi:hypothetical protein
MKFYGYTSDPEQSPMELSEVTVSADPILLRQLSVFLAKCADGIENSGGLWEHEHFVSNKSLGANVPSFIVYNSKGK